MAGSKMTCGALVRLTSDLDLEVQDKERIWLEDAQGLEAQGLIVTARALLSYSSETFPQNESNWVELIGFEVRHGDPAAVAAVCDSALEKCSGSEKLWLLAIEHAQKQSENPERARKLLEQAFEKHSDKESLFLAAAELEVAAGDHEKARGILATGRKKSGSPRVWMKSAQLERLLGKHERAYELCRDALKLHKGFPKLWMIAGQLQARFKNHEKAMKIYQLGLSHNKNSVPLWVCLVKFHETSGNYPRALA